MYKDNTLSEFFQKLSSNKPVPGGGGAVGISLCISISLTEMVLNIVSNRKKFKELENSERFEIENAINFCSKFREKSLDFIDEDAKNFINLMEAIKLKRKPIDEYYISALTLPLNFIKQALELYDTIKLADKYCGEFLVSDVNIAIDMLNSSIKALGDNVEINIINLKDEENIRNNLNSLLKSNTIKYNDIRGLKI